MNTVKKVIAGLVCCVLVGCQGGTDKKSGTGDTQSPQDIVMKKLYNGDGNENGLYHIASREVDGNMYTNIYYYDYASKKEIYLCDKPECKHIDESCTSYVENGLNAYLFLHGKYVYILSNEQAGFSMDDGSDTNEHKEGAKLLRMDTDGKNKKKYAPFQLIPHIVIIKFLPIKNICIYP